MNPTPDPHRGPRRLRRSLAVVGLCAAVAISTSGCIVESGRGEQSRSLITEVSCPVTPDQSITGTIRIGYQQIPNGDLVVKDSDILGKCMPNADIAWTQFSSGADVVRAFGANSLDLGLFGSAPAAKALSAPLNLPVSVVWIQDVIGGAESLVVRDPSITSVDQLHGKKIGVPFGSTSHLSLMAALTKAGLTSEVTVINLEPSAILGAWQGGQIDAAWIWEPTLSELTRDGHVIMTAKDTADAGSPTFDLSGARTDFVKENPAAMRLWTMAQDWAVQQITQNPEEAVARISGQLGVTPDQVRTQLKGYIYLTAKEQAEPRWFGGGLARSLFDTASFLKDQGEIDGVSPQQVYDNAVYAAAIKEVAGQ
ncbi:taurine ABC transporter substrate-binding protein [Gordonia sp. NPDC003950]